MEGFFGIFDKQESFLNHRCDDSCALDADLRSDFQLAIIDLDSERIQSGITTPIEV